MQTGGSQNCKQGEGEVHADASKNKWTQRETESVDGDEKANDLPNDTASSFLADLDLLSRCLIGKFEEDEVPTTNDVKHWPQQTWKVTQGVQVYDMNGVLFLFEFPSIKAAEHILMGDWRR